MSAPEPRSKPTQGQATNPASRLIAVGASLLLHAAALAGFIQSRTATPPEPLQVVAVELVHASDLVGISDGKTSKEESESRSKARRDSDAPGLGQDPAQVEPQDDLGRPAVAPETKESSAGDTGVDDEPDHLAAVAALASSEPGPAEANQRDTAVKPIAVELLGASDSPTLATLPPPPIPRPKPKILSESFRHAEARTTGPAERTRLRATPRALATEPVLNRSGVISNDEPSEHKLPIRARSDRASDKASTYSAADRRGFDEPAGQGPFAPPKFGGSGLSNPAPQYPYLARRQGQAGRVLLRVQVSAAGDAKAVAIRRSSGYRLLDDAALDAVRKWRFVPASRGGISVAAPVDVPISFKLTD